MRRVAIAFFAAGGLSALARTYAPDPDPSDHGALLFLALVCLVGTLALVAWRRPPEALLRCLPEVGVLLVSAGVAVSTPLASATTYYLLPLVASAYFSSTRRLVADLVLFAVSLTVVLALWVEPGVRVAIFVGTAIPALFAAAVVAGLKQRLDAHVDDLRELASTDPLTGMLNHGAFGVALERACAAEAPRDAAAVRHRPLQDRQRPLRPPGGRPDAAARQRPAGAATSAATTRSAGSAARSSGCCWSRRTPGSPSSSRSACAPRCAPPRR